MGFRCSRSQDTFNDDTDRRTTVEHAAYLRSVERRCRNHTSQAASVFFCGFLLGSVREQFFLINEIKSEDRKFSGLGLGLGLGLVLLLGLLPARTPMRLLATRLAGYRSGRFHNTSVKARRNYNSRLLF